MTGRGVDRRALAVFVGGDLATYALLYWLVVPAFAAVLDALDPVMSVAVGHVLTAVRLTFLGAVAVRSVRARHGLAARTDAVPTVVVAALTGWVLHLVLGVTAAWVLGTSPWTWGVLPALLEWLGFALLGAMFVQPGSADVDGVPLRFRRLARSESGSVSMVLVPAVAAVLTVTVLAVVVLGSATNDRREATTAADAAALAAAQEWQDALRLRFLDGSRAASPAAFWALAGTPLASVTPGDAMRAEAARFAERNGAELVDLRVDPARAQVTVTVRSLDTVPESATRMESTATSELRFRSGLCRDGGRLGYLIERTCRTGAPPEPDAGPGAGPTPPPADPADPAAPPPPPPPPPPFEVPDGLDGWDMDVVLTQR